MAITGRFVLLVAFGVVPVVVAGPSGADAAWLALLGWLALSLGLGAIDLSLAASPRRVVLARDLPPRVRLGESVVSTLTLTNTGERTLRATVRDAWEPSAGVVGTNRARVAVPSGERRSIRHRLQPWRRGDRRTELVSIRAAGPLGLWSRQASLHAPGLLRVLPPFHSRVHLPARLTRLRELDGRTPLLVRGQGTEFDSIREYVRGDDVRSIDWRATARHVDPGARGSAKLMVRTWRPERDRRIVIVADTSRTAAARIADEPRLDTAWESTLLLSALATHAGDRVDFLAWDRRARARVTGATGPHLLAQLVDAMADVQAELIEADWTGLPAQIRRITSRRALVVLLTAADAPGTARGLLSVLPQLASRHTVIVASVLDPDTVADAARRDGVDELYLAAASERSGLDGERVAAAIRHSGAHTVSAVPHELPPALADRYLDLKASGQL
jgi:uncharacterized protein (DUF58 family)